MIFSHQGFPVFAHLLVKLTQLLVKLHTYRIGVK